jgi:hypothetical protein
MADNIRVPCTVVGLAGRDIIVVVRLVITAFLSTLFSNLLFLRAERSGRSEAGGAKWRPKIE